MNPAQLFVKIRSALLASWRLAFFMSFPAAASAQASQPAYVPASSAVSAGSMLQMLTGLLLVLAVIGAAAWLLKRFAANPGTATGAIKVIAGAAVGQRERVVLVEIGGTWLVLGVAPGQVRALHTLPKASAEHSGNDLPAPPGKGFQVWLRQVMEKRNAG
jgi:flagellar protein FliO/FliZ